MGRARAMRGRGGLPATIVVAATALVMLALLPGGPVNEPPLRLLGAKPKGKLRVDRVGETSIKLKWRDRAMASAATRCMSGSTDARWDDDNLNQLKDVPGTAFEVVDTGQPIRPADAPCAS